jgi:thiosulfate reductase cytochrome b subunit
MNDRLYLYPAIIRVWHFFNALFIIILILSGLSMQYSDPSRPFLRFDIAVTFHNYSGILLALNYSLFIIGNIITGNAKHYKIKMAGLSNRLTQQFRYYTRDMFFHTNPPFPVTKKSKFNPIQQVTYFTIMFILLPVLFITGLSLLYSGSFIREILGNKALFYTDMLHLMIGFFLSIFLVVHLYVCTVGKSPFLNFKSMVTGYHEGH